MTRRILIINGPNLNLLGTREPHIYGSTTLQEIVSAAAAQASSLGVHVDTFQSNHEGAIVDRIQAAAGFGPLAEAQPSADAHGGQGGKREQNFLADVIIINPAGLVHTSVVIRDALLGVKIPFIEVHVSNIHAREEWRHHSYLHDKAVGVICGLGAYGYTAAVEYAARHLKLKGKGEGS